MKHRKRVVSWLLIISLILVSSVSSYANGLNGSVDDQIVEKAFGEHRDERVITKIGTTVYHVPNTGVDSYVTTYHDNFGNTVRFFFELGDVDYILYSSDGNIYINGGKVISASSTKLPQDTSLRYRTVEYSSTPWFGPSSNYSIDCGIISNSSVYTGGDPIASLTVGLIADLICWAFGIPSVWVTIILGIANNLKTSAELYAPDSAYYSYYGCKKEHSTASNPVNRYYMYDINYYSKENYQQYVGNSVYYESNYFN